MLWVVMAPKVSWLLTYLLQKAGERQGKTQPLGVPKALLAVFLDNVLAFHSHRWWWRLC